MYSFFLQPFFRSYVKRKSTRKEEMFWVFCGHVKSLQLAGLQLLVGETSVHPWIKICVIGAARPCSERKTSPICFSTRIRFSRLHFVVTAQTTCSKEIAHADLLTSCYRVHSRAYLITVATDTGCYRT